MSVGVGDGSGRVYYPMWTVTLPLDEADDKILANTEAARGAAAAGGLTGIYRLVGDYTGPDPWDGRYYVEIVWRGWRYE